MTVNDVIEKLAEETYDNEKEHQLKTKDEQGNIYRVTGYDWCNAILLVEKI